MGLFSRYSKDNRFKIAMAFLLVFGIVWIKVEPSHWPYVVGYWVLILIIAIVKRNSP